MKGFLFAAALLHEFMSSLIEYIVIYSEVIFYITHFYARIFVLCACFPPLFCPRIMEAAWTIIN